MDFGSSSHGIESRASCNRVVQLTRGGQNSAKELRSGCFIHCKALAH